MSASPSSLQLDELRRAIDAIDDGILELVQRRFQTVQGVKAVKTSDPGAWPSPLRPGREMQILKRLLAQADGSVPPETLVRLWRSIITESTLKQSSVTLHVPRKLAGSIADRLMLRDHFGRFSVAECRDETQALVQVNVAPGDLCVVETSSAWIDPFLEGKAGKAQVMGTLPVIGAGEVPNLLVFGVAPAQATGEDETLLISKGSLPRDFAVQPLWQIKLGSHRLSALAGFYSEHESPLIGLMRSNPGLGLAVAGRYPSAIST